MDERAAGPRRRQHALELVLGPDDDAGVRASWDALERAGVRSSARHRGATHRPHVTVVSGPRPDDRVLELAAQLWGRLLPSRLAVGGLVLLGGPRYALGELLVPDAATLTARARLQEAWAGADPRPWVPHLTLAPRVGPHEVGAAVAAVREEAAPEGVGHGIPHRVAAALRWWDPDAAEVHEIADQPS